MKTTNKHLKNYLISVFKANPDLFFKIFSEKFSDDIFEKFSEEFSDNFSDVILNKLNNYYKDVEYHSVLAMVHNIELYYPKEPDFIEFSILVKFTYTYFEARYIDTQSEYTFRSFINIHNIYTKRRLPIKIKLNLL